MTDGGEIRVAIIEDDCGVREGLATLIESAPGYRIAGTYASVETALGSMAGHPADVVLLDIHLPGVSGAKGVGMIKERLPAVQVLMLTIYAEQELVFESICNGACGYLLKKTPPGKLLEAIGEVHAGGAPMSPEIARQIVTLFQTAGPPERLDQALTPHELRVLKLLSEGRSYQGLAEHFHVSINTVRNYIRSIYEKLHVHSKSEAVGKAMRSRLIR